MKTIKKAGSIIGSIIGLILLYYVIGLLWTVEWYLIFAGVISIFILLLILVWIGVSIQKSRRKKIMAKGIYVGIQKCRSCKRNTNYYMVGKDSSSKNKKHLVCMACNTKYPIDEEKYSEVLKTLPTIPPVTYAMKLYNAVIAMFNEVDSKLLKIRNDKNLSNDQKTNRMFDFIYENNEITKNEDEVSYILRRVLALAFNKK